MSSFKTYLKTLAFCSIFCSLNSSVMYAPNTPIQFLCVRGLFCKDYLSEMNCLYSTGEALSLRFCPVPFFILRRQQRSVPLREGDYIWRWDEGTSHCLVAWTDPCWHSENDPKLFHLKVPIVLSSSLYSIFPHLTHFYLFKRSIWALFSVQKPLNIKYIHSRLISQIILHGTTI